MSKFKPEVVTPVEHEDQWAILDYNAVVRHCQGMGNDPDAVYGSATGREINTAEHTVRCFLDAYIIPILDAGFTPRQILVAHDDGHVYRSKILPAYKAKRDKRKGDDSTTDKEIFEQFEKANDSIKRILAYMGCTQFKVEGVEGDDIIPYLCKLKGPKSIYTVDADILRLSAPDTIVYLKNTPIYVNDFELDDLPKNMHKFVAPFFEMKGFDQEQLNVFKYLTLYKSIVGDTSDEYIGIKGYGDSKWKEIVEEFDTDGLDELIAIVSNKDWVTLASYVKQYEEHDKGCKAHKILAKLHEDHNAWRTCWIVADLHPELCWKPFKAGKKSRMTELTWFKRVPNKGHITKLLERNLALEYLEDLEPYLPLEWLIDANSFEGDGDIEEFRQLCEESPHISFDYEGATDYQDWIDKLLSESSMQSYVDVLGQDITGVSFNFGSNLQYTCYLTINHKDSANLPLGVVRQFFEAIPKDKIKVAHNSQFEEVLTYNCLDGYVMPIGTVLDTSIMSTYDDENKESHSLKALSSNILGYRQATYQETLDAAGVSNMRELTANQVLKYGLDDSTVTGHLYDVFRISLQLQDCWDFYINHEPYVNHRMAMSFIEGTDIDWERLEEIRVEDDHESKEAVAELREILEEHCSSVNREAAESFFNEEKKFLEASARAKYMKLDDAKVLEKADSVAEEIENMDMADETFLEIAERIRMKIPAARGKKAKAERDLSKVEAKPMIAWILRFDMHKAKKKFLQGSVYVKYTENWIPPAFAPTVKNLDAVATKLGLLPPGTAAKGKLEAWETNIREIDFEAEIDKFDEFNEVQQEFIVLLREARNHFKPDQREHEDFVAFQKFCCQQLELEGKTTYSGTELNLGSSNQMKELFYCMLGLPVRLRGVASKSRKDLGFWEGSPATDKLMQDTALAEDIVVNVERAWQERVINLVKKATECNTRKSLYHTSYPLLRHPKTGKLHPSVRNCGTVTRRPTGSQPNILQVSKHQKKGAMRGIYIPPRGYCVMPIDFAGQELRIQASETKDPNLLSVYLGSELTGQYLRGEVLDVTYNMVKDKTDLKDLHSMTAFGITEHFGLDESGDLVAGGQNIKWTPPSYEDYVEARSDKDHEFHKLTNKVRSRPAKQTNFLLSYGGTEQTLSHRLIIPLATATSIMDSTLTLYSGIPTAQEDTLKFARENGFAVTAYGNRRHATDDIFSSSKGPVNRQVRQLYNFRIQGCAADILKVVLANCEKTKLWSRYDAIMVAPVYDEVVAYVPFEHAWDFVQDLRNIMNLTPPGHAVPMVADVSVGPNWQVQYELGDQPTREAFDKCMEEKVIPEANAIWERIDCE